MEVHVGGAQRAAPLRHAPGTCVHELLKRTYNGSSIGYRLCAAAASGKPGLAVLSPLMAHADETLVKQTVRRVLRATPLPEQNELLTIPGVLAERFVTEKRFVQLVGKKRLMESKLLEYLMEERTAELQAKLRAELKAREEVFANRESAFEAREAVFAACQDAIEAQLQLQVEREARQRADLEAHLQRQAEQEARQAVVAQLQQALQASLVARFPHLPPTLLLAAQRVVDPTVLSQLTVAAVRATDVTAFDQTL